MLYGSPVMQNFINHVPIQQSCCKKYIYQPGSLRKVIRRYFLNLRVNILKAHSSHHSCIFITSVGTPGCCMSFNR